MEGKIDFVLPWVDGSDPAWLIEKNKFSQDTIGDKRDNRFRDWGLMRYWFRSVEKNAPWVNKVHFVTWGHVPEWLNSNNEKLNIVYHKDFIPEQYLPTFNSRTIEWNVFRIDGLSESFVLFNDDTFLCQPTSQDYFFKDGVPCDAIVEAPYICYFRNSIGSIVANNMEIINTSFNKREQVKRNFFKWFNIKYRKKNLITLCAARWYYFLGFEGSHLPNAYCKSTFQTLWDREYVIIDQTCMHKFRDKRDVNHWLARGWQLASGNFVPRSPYGRSYVEITDNNTRIVEAVSGGNYRMLCLNDKDCKKDIEKAKAELQNAFASILPEKCSFEK